MPIDGLVSGLDTTSIINQLMDLERRPIEQLTVRMNTAQGRLDAYGSIRSKLSSLASLSGDVGRASTWQAKSATSSNDASATVTAASTAATGTFSFSVDQLAASHGVASSSSIAAMSTVVSSSGSLDITVSGSTETIAVGAGTLEDVIAGINDADIGIRASAVNTGSGYRLQLNATASGAASTFTVDSGLDVATAVTSTGADALLSVGTGPGAYQVSSSTNVFATTFEGLTVTAKAVSASPVTVTVSSDAEAIADKLEGLATALNGALSEVKTRTAYDAANNRAATLTGDSAARRITQGLVAAVTGAVSQSTIGSAGAAGLQIDRYGAVTFDRAAFLAAYADNPTEVQQLFARGGDTTGSVEFVSASASTVEGSYDVVVTQAASQATKVGMVGFFPITTPRTIRVVVGSTEIYYAANNTETDTEVAAGLQAAADAEGLNLTIAPEGGGIGITTGSYGSSASFEVAWDGATYETATGSDVAGTIGGEVATGRGQLLTVGAESGDPSGLSVLVTATGTGNAGSIDYSAGVAGRLSAAIVNATDTASGYLTGAENASQSRIDLFESSIRGYEDRLDIREQRLRKQFVGLEIALGRMQEQSSFLASQLSSLSGFNQNDN